MPSHANLLCQFVTSTLSDLADPANAGPMQAYMKTDMPFHGEARLFRYCLARCHETELFTRKAIGWALRQHS